MLSSLSLLAAMLSERSKHILTNLQPTWKLERWQDGEAGRAGSSGFGTRGEIEVFPVDGA